MASRFFDGITQRDVHLMGFEARLPFLYRDSATLFALFTASTARVAKLLPDPDLHPIALGRGRCLLSVTALDHRQSDLGAYREVIVGPLVAFGHRPLPILDAVAALARRSFDVHVLHLPVTSERACAAGVELYGLPKLSAEIAFGREDGRLTCAVSEGGQLILALAADDPGIYSPRRAHARLYSALRGALLSADVELNLLEHAHAPRQSAALELGPAHRVARDLAALDVEPRPLLAQLATRGEMILYGPHPAHVPLARTGS